MRARLFVFLVSCLFLVLSLPAEGDKLFTVSPADDKLRVLDPITGKAQATITLTVANQTVNQCNGLAMHPTTGEVWVIMKLSGVTGRSLGKVNLSTGVVSVVGTTGDNFAGIVFDDKGTLFGVTGDGGSTAETLFTISLTNAATTKFLTLGNGDDGETIGFHPTDKVIYHASGIGTANVTEIFETVDPATKKITQVTLSGDSYDEALAITHLAGGNFLLADVCDELFLVNRMGVVSKLADLDHSVKGMVFVPAKTGAFSRFYGGGCGGSGGNIPALFASACPKAGTTATMSVVNGLGGAACVLALGTSNASAPIGPQCFIHILPMTNILIPLTLGGTGAGNGTAALSVNLPSGLKGDGYLQAAVVDNSALVLTNPLQMHIE